MGPIPNPIGTRGFAFIEFSSPDPKHLTTLLPALGFSPHYRHKQFDIIVYQQNAIFLLVNQSLKSFASRFNEAHGPAACGMGFLVEDQKEALQKLIAKDAKPAPQLEHENLLGFPCIEGIGGSLLYLVDPAHWKTFLSQDCEPLSTNNTSCQLNLIDHLTHNLYQGHLNQWAQYYESLFNFREIRYFDINGKQTGLVSRAMTSPCGNIRIPLNESKDDKSQIAEYLAAYRGEGIQHIALSTDNIYETVESLRKNGIQFLTIPETYYELLPKRIPNHQENLPRLAKNRILMDNDPAKPNALLLQIFTENMIGPIFFEIIQRKGNEGFGEGNFQALFESMELDQIRRGVL